MRLESVVELVGADGGESFRTVVTKHARLRFILAMQLFCCAPPAVLSISWCIGSISELRGVDGAGVQHVGGLGVGDVRCGVRLLCMGRGPAW